MGLSLAFASALLLLPLLSRAVIVEDFQSLPTTVYDFVIVGGGTAGCAIANRLSENPLHNILLLEAGPNGEGVLNIMVPVYRTNLPGTAYHWNYSSLVQPQLNNRIENVPRGHVLGGTSSVNGMAYSRGSADDWNLWAKLTGDEGWSWDKILPYYLKSERWSPPADNHDTTGEYNPDFHNTEGILGVSLPNYRQVLAESMLEAAQQVGLEYNEDVNDGSPLGVAWQPTTTSNGTRSSSASAYLAPEYASRPNLHVVVNHRAIQLLETSTTNENSVPDVRTVVFRRNNSTTSLNVTASKEVILSAGTYGTPQLLLLSGIGSAQELEDVGIPAIVDLPSVGKNLTDHVLLSMDWNVTGKETMNGVSNQTYQQEILEEWLQNRTGPLTNPWLSMYAWTRLPDDWPGWEVHDDPSSGKSTAHFEYLPWGIGGDYPVPGPAITTAFLFHTPTSRGTVSLNASDPLGKPLIDTKTLSSAFDIVAVREGVVGLKKLMTAQAWNDWGLVPTGVLGEAQTDEELDDAIRIRAGNAFHCVSTSMMTPEDASFGVVNPDLRVKKVSGLRIVDASVMPHVPSAHISAPVYAIAERAADLVKAYWAEKI